jgi:hypothetical protein
MKFLVALPLLLVAATPINAQPSVSSVVLPPGNLVVNGGFEWGFGGWQGTYGYLDPRETGQPVPALEGRNTGVVTDVSSSSVGQPMWQILTTIPGVQYDFRFSLLSGYGLVGEQSQGNLGSPVNVYWGGGLLGVGSQYLGVFRNTSTTTWQTWDFQLTAASSSTMIQFVDLSDKRWQLIDAVSVVPVPEPTASSLVLSGLIVFGLYSLRRNHLFHTRENVDQHRH